MQKLMIEIFDGVFVEDENDPYCLAVVKQVGHGPISVPLPTHWLIDTRRCIEHLIKAGLTATYSRSDLTKIFNEAVGRKRKANNKIATKPGWHDGQYLLQGKMITRKGAVGAWMADAHPKQRALQEKIETDEKLEEDLVELLPKSLQLQFAVLATFAAPVFALLDEPEMPIIHIYGKRKTGKTTLLEVMNALQRDVSDRVLTPFDFTKTGLEEKLVKANHSVLCLDEVGNMKATELADIVETYLYYIAGGQSRARPANLFKNVSWRSMVAFTGEFSLHDVATRKVGSGQDARVISMKVAEHGIWTCAKGFDGEKALETLRLSSKTYSGALYKRWIRTIVNYGADGARGRFKEKVDAYIDRLVGDRIVDGLVKTLARKFAVIGVTGDCLQNMKAFPKNTWSPFETVKALFEADLDEKLTGAGIETRDHRLTDLAVSLLAAATAHRIPIPDENGTTPRTDLCPAFIAQKKGQEYLFVYKDQIARFLSRGEVDVFDLLKSSAGLLQGSRGEGTFGQFGKGRRSVLQINFRRLLEIGWPQATLLERA